jgi:crossover junction endodeoxyribonuclease RusA
VLQPWRDSIAWHARQAAGPARWDGPVHVDLTFVFVRPAAHYGTGRNARVLKPSAPAFPATRGQGDVDKLARAVLDALTASGVFLDDSQVSSLAARKVWTGPVFDRPCLRVELGPLHGTACT